MPMTTTMEPVSIKGCLSDCLDELERLDDLSLARDVPATPFKPVPALMPRRHLNAMSPTNRRCALYRQYDAAGVLLYVGISSKPSSRRQTHLQHSAWTEFAAVESAIWYDTIEEATAAERDAIIDEQPLFNVTYSDHSRDLRLRDYLLDRQAWHLLEQTAPWSQYADPVLNVCYTLDARVLEVVE